MGTVARKQASEKISEKILRLTEYQQATTIAAFAPMPEEVDIWHVIENAVAAAKTVALPRIVNFGDGKMTFHRLQNRAELVAGAKGITEPPPTAPLIKNQLFDFLLIPAVAVDSNNHRLGYGGGFYDIFLSRQKVAFSCAPVFRCQLVDALPSEPHDKKIRLVITE